MAGVDCAQGRRLPGPGNRRGALLQMVLQVETSGPAGAARQASPASRPRPRSTDAQARGARVRRRSSAGIPPELARHGHRGTVKVAADPGRAAVQVPARAGGSYDVRLCRCSGRCPTTSRCHPRGRPILDEQAKAIDRLQDAAVLAGQPRLPTTSLRRGGRLVERATGIDKLLAGGHHRRRRHADAEEPEAAGADRGHATGEDVQDSAVVSPFPFFIGSTATSSRPVRGSPRPRRSGHALRRRRSRPRPAAGGGHPPGRHGDVVGQVVAARRPDSRRPRTQAGFPAPTTCPR